MNRHYLQMFAAAGAVGILSGLTLPGSNPYAGALQGFRAGAGQGFGQGATQILSAVPESSADDHDPRRPSAQDLVHRRCPDTGEGTGPQAARLRLWITLLVTGRFARRRRRVLILETLHQLDVLKGGRRAVEANRSDQPSLWSLLPRSGLRALLRHRSRPQNSQRIIDDDQPGDSIITNQLTQIQQFTDKLTEMRDQVQPPEGEGAGKLSRPHFPLYRSDIGKDRAGR